MGAFRRQYQYARDRLYAEDNEGEGRMSGKQRKNQPIQHDNSSEDLKDYLPKKASDYQDRSTKQDKQEEQAFQEQKKRVKHQSEEIPPLSQSEKEHLTYLRVMKTYNEMKAKQKSYRHYGVLFILLSGLIYLLLIFSLDTKVEFLILWIATVLFCVFLMVRADYHYYTYKELLGIADEFDYYDYDEDEQETEPPKLSHENSITVAEKADPKDTVGSVNLNKKGG